MLIKAREFHSSYAQLFIIASNLPNKKFLLILIQIFIQRILVISLFTHCYSYGDGSHGKKNESLKSTFIWLLHLCEMGWYSQMFISLNELWLWWAKEITKLKKKYFSSNRLSFDLIRRNQNNKAQPNYICSVVVYFFILWTRKLRSNYVLYTQKWPTIGTVTIKWFGKLNADVYIDGDADDYYYLLIYRKLRSITSSHNHNTRKSV